MKVGDKYFVNRLGYSNSKKGDDCKNIYDIMGYVTITVTKVNQKSFRTDYDDELYKEVPNGWYEYNTKLLHEFTLSRIARILAETGGMSYYNKNAKEAFFKLSEEDKIKLGNKISWILDERLATLRKNYTDTINTRLATSERYKTDRTDYISKYINQKEED